MCDDDVIKILIKYNKIVPSRTNEKYLKKHNLYTYLINRYTDSMSIKETIYRIYKNIEIRPKCKICGNNINFIGNKFATYCSKKCSNSDPVVLQKNKENVSKALKAAYLANGDIIKEKRKQTLSKHYGINSTSSPFSIDHIRIKASESIISKYNVPNVFYLSQFRRSRKDMQECSIKYQKSKGFNISYINPEASSNELQVLIYKGCEKHGDIVMPWTLFNNRSRHHLKYGLCMCPICNPVRNQETSIETIIKNILIKYNINFIQHDRTYIYPYELDFFLTDYNIAIECNGSFWHSGYTSFEKHKKKMTLCTNKNIQLLYFWSYQIYNDIANIENDLINRLNIKITEKEMPIYIENNIAYIEYYANNSILQKLKEQNITHIAISNERSFISNNLLYINNIEPTFYYVDYHKEKIIQLSDITLKYDKDIYYENNLNMSGVSQCWNLGYKLYQI